VPSAKIACTAAAASLLPTATNQVTLMLYYGSSAKYHGTSQLNINEQATHLHFNSAGEV